jgi:hypothetical protein
VSSEHNFVVAREEGKKTLLRNREGEAFKLRSRSPGLDWRSHRPPEQSSWSPLSPLRSHKRAGGETNLAEREALLASPRGIGSRGIFRALGRSFSFTNDKMACTALYFMSLRGDVLIARTYRDEAE